MVLAAVEKVELAKAQDVGRSPGSTTRAQPAQMVQFSGASDVSVG
jgi:hypothetical protein